MSYTVDLQSLKGIFPSDRFPLINSEWGFLLNDTEWNALKAIIVQRNPDLKTVISGLEEKQHQKAVLTRKEALVYDAVHSSLQTFFGKNLPEELQDSFDAWRRRLLRENNDNVILEIIPDLKTHHPEIFRKHDDIQDPHHREMSQLFGNDKFREEDSIHHDFDNPGIGLEKVSARFQPEVETQMCVAKDPETGRELVLYMAHRKGYKQSDLLNADIIYESLQNKSLVIVQYKRLNLDDTIRPHGEQLEKLLKLCTKHDCANQSQSSSIMRLLDCPVYYKLLDHHPRIESNRQTTNGLYIPACQLNKLAQENKGVVCRQPHLDRCLQVSSFFQLLRTSQIGCKAMAFDSLRNMMKDHMSKDIFAPAEDGNLLVYAAELA